MPPAAAELFRLDSDTGAVVARLSVETAEFWVADESPEHFNFSLETLGGSSAPMVMIAEDPAAAFEGGSQIPSDIIGKLGSLRQRPLSFHPAK